MYITPFTYVLKATVHTTVFVSYLLGYWPTIPNVCYSEGPLLRG